jgi:Biotin-lipoyl like
MRTIPRAFGPPLAEIYPPFLQVLGTRLAPLVLVALEEEESSSKSKSKKQSPTEKPETSEEKKDTGDDKKKSEGSDKDKKESDQPKKPPAYKRPAVIIVVSAVLLVAIVGGLLYWLHARHFVSTDDAYIDGHVVQIAPQVPAPVIALRVSDNELVRKGELLVELDPTDYEVALQQAGAQLAASQGRVAQAEAQLEQARAGVAQASAEVDAAEVSLSNATADLQRYLTVDQRARSQQQLDNAITAQKNNQAQFEQAKARKVSAEASVNTAAASIKAAEGDTRTAGEPWLLQNLRACRWPRDATNGGSRELRRNRFGNVHARLSGGVGHGQLQGNAASAYAPRPAGHHKSGCIFQFGIERPCGLHPGRVRLAVRRFAGGKCDRQFCKNRSARAGEDRF